MADLKDTAKVQLNMRVDASTKEKLREIAAADRRDMVHTIEHLVEQEWLRREQERVGELCHG